MFGSVSHRRSRKRVTRTYHTCNSTKKMQVRWVRCHGVKQPFELYNCAYRINRQTSLTYLTGHPLIKPLANLHIKKVLFYKHYKQPQRLWFQNNDQYNHLLSWQVPLIIVVYLWFSNNKQPTQTLPDFQKVIVSPSRMSLPFARDKPEISGPSILIRLLPHNDNLTS